MDRLSTLNRQLEMSGQHHLVQQLDRLDGEAKSSLLQQLGSIDIIDLKNVFDTVVTKPSDQITGIIESPTEIDSASVNRQRWWDVGIRLIKQGAVAVLTLAGGQGTRLGSSLPKGCFDIGLPNHKSLFQLQAERISQLEQQSGSQVAWYIMTSDSTHEITANFFRDNDYFGLERQRVVLFQQQSIPCFDENGKMLLETPDRLLMSPSGNGGLYHALHAQGILKDMKQRGIEHVHVYCVDNVLVRVGDPVFIGYCSEKRADCGTKVVERERLDEPLGILCKRNGVYSIIEYSELDTKLCDPTVYRYGNIANHYFSREFLERLSTEQLEYHIARKKVSHFDPQKYKVVQTDNAIKLETFIFDVFPKAQRMALLLVERNEFSPLKNAKGRDSPETARKALMELPLEVARQAGWVLEDGKLTGM